MYINVAGLKEGDRGNAVYDVAANYAVNNDLVFKGDPGGLSDAAMRRRLENMLSSATKYGTTDHLEPHPRQLQGDASIGVPALKWTTGDTLGNTRWVISEPWWMRPSRLQTTATYLEQPLNTIQARSASKTQLLAEISEIRKSKRFLDWMTDMQELERLAIPLYKERLCSNPWFKAKEHDAHFWSQYIGSGVNEARELVRQAQLSKGLSTAETPTP